MSPPSPGRGTWNSPSTVAAAGSSSSLSSDRDQTWEVESQETLQAEESARESSFSSFSSLDERDPRGGEAKFRVRGTPRQLPVLRPSRYPTRTISFNPLENDNSSTVTGSGRSSIDSPDYKEIQGLQLSDFTSFRPHCDSPPEFWYPAPRPDPDLFYQDFGVDSLRQLNSITMPTTSRDPAGVERTRPLYEVINNDKKRVAYFYDSDIGNYAYVTGHPMKPHRIRLAHSLVMNYNVYKFLEIYVIYQHLLLAVALG